jgi:hypothetical protein
MVMLLLLLLLLLLVSSCRWIPMMMAFGGMFMFTMFPLMALGIFPLGLMLKNLASLVRVRVGLGAREGGGGRRG